MTVTEGTRETAAEPGKGVAGHRLSLVLAACCLGQFMNVLDASVVNVALPVISADLHFTQHNLQLVNNAYTVVVCGFLLLGGRLADLFGQRRIFACGVALFTLASLVGGAADAPVTLVLARAFQGLGAAVMAPATLTVLGTTFTEPAARARAFGWWSAVSGAAGAIGVLAGGVIIEWFSWRWIFLVNVPIGLVLFAAVRWVVPETRPRRTGRGSGLDLPGAVTVTLGLMSAVYGVSQYAAHGWGSPRVLGPLLAGALLITAFLVIQARFARHPLVPLGIFRNRSVAAANLVAFFGIAALFSTFYFFTLVLQQVLGYSPLHTGLSYLPLSVGMALGGWGIAPLVPRAGPRPILLGGLTLAAGALFWLSSVDAGADYLGDVLGPCVLLGSGMGAVLNATTNAATAGLAPHQAGLASGLLNTTRQLGSAVGLVTLAALSAARIDARTGAGASAVDARAAGYGLALTGAALFAVAGFVAALFVPVRKQSRIPQGDTGTPRGDTEKAAV
ncbi:MFS transporter [Streptomyces sp. NBC_01474]|uniref:MFS transporter n=1 Tax=unclassified Streptomyces TaxID=2593676 RepID=UPI002DDB95D0|nr:MULTISPECIES: MFS transporter [unclassified Streptomyces]WSD95689.1 MFS transporter [Streptomyces sp. NBC_01474]